MNALEAPEPGQKFDYVNEPIHLPRPWVDMATQIGLPTGTARAVIMREAIRYGLPICAKTRQMGEELVSSLLALPPVEMRRGRKPKSRPHEQSQRLPGI